MDAQKNCLMEMVLLSTHNLCFWLRNNKNKANLTNLYPPTKCYFREKRNITKYNSHFSNPNSLTHGYVFALLYALHPSQLFSFKPRACTESLSMYLAKKKSLLLNDTTLCCRHDRKLLSLSHSSNTL